MSGGEQETVEIFGEGGHLPAPPFPQQFTGHRSVQHGGRWGGASATVRLFYTPNPRLRNTADRKITFFFVLTLNTMECFFQTRLPTSQTFHKPAVSHFPTSSHKWGRRAPPRRGAGAGLGREQGSQPLDEALVEGAKLEAGGCAPALGVFPHPWGSWPE